MPTKACMDSLLFPRRERIGLGVLSLDVTCQCGREVIVDASHLSGLIEIPTLRRRLKCIDVRPDWSQHRAQGRG